MKKLIERFKAEETRIGKIFAYALPSILGATAIIVETLEEMQKLPFEMPFDTKKTIAVLTFIGFVYGKFTKKDNN